MGYNMKAINTNPISEGLDSRMLLRLQARNRIDGFAW
jgi:hypothetical protein